MDVEIQSALARWMQRSREGLLRQGSAAEEIEQIDAALTRIATGAYGMCVTCRREIALTRLRILPATPVCLRCARRHRRLS